MKAKAAKAKAQAKDNLSAHCVGWEAICNLPDEYVVVVPTDLHYFYAPLASGFWGRSSWCPR